MGSTILLVVASILATVSPSNAVSSTIIKPIRSEGDEVALIFIPGAYIKGRAYNETAIAIQKNSPLRVWAALTGNYTLDVASSLEIGEAVEGAIDNLKKAGMKGDNYVGIGHSLAGVFLWPYAENSPLKAVVLMGAYVSRSTKLSDYPKPLLTLSGELDGQTRITRIAVEYQKLQHDIKNSSNAIYRTPVINIKGSCHAQFASGPMPKTVRDYDLKPDISDEEAHDKIGHYVNSFLMTTFSTKSSQVMDGKNQLKDAYTDSGLRFQPLLDIKALDTNGTTSPWSIFTQAQLAGQYVTEVKIKNTIETNPWFLLSKPSITKTKSGVLVNTTSLIAYESNEFDISTVPESPKEIDVKMKSNAAIAEALNNTITEDLLRQNLSCRALNEMAFQVAIKQATSEARDRYKQRGRPLTFEDDVVYGTGIQWSTEPLQIVEDDSGLHVQSVALFTSTTSAIYAGMHYCKVLSPYRAMEWIHVDSLREHKP